MKKYKKLIAMLLAGAMFCVLTACGSSDEAEWEGNAKDLAEGILMVIGNESIPYEEAFAYVYMLKQQYEPAMGDNIWDFQLEEGVDFESYAKDQIVDLIMQVKIICQQGEKLDIHLTEEEIWEARNMAVRFMETVSEEDAAEYRLSEELMAGIYEDHILAEKVYEIVTNEADTSVSNKEAKQRAKEYLANQEQADEEGKKINLNDEDTLMEIKEAIIAERKDELFRQKYLEWSERIKLVISTAVWDAIEF